MQNSSGAYIIQRRPRQRGPKRRGAGLLILALLILTAAICVLIAVLPRMSGSRDTAAPAFSGRTFYMLVTGESDTYSQAYETAQMTAARGGAGYIYNDGRYKVIAAAYAKESDAEALASVNSGTYFALDIPAALGGAEASAMDYLCGEWFNAVSYAASELDRGNITEAAAERAVRDACKTLSDMADGLTGRFSRAFGIACEYAMPASRGVLSYIRYIAVRALDALYAALA